MFDPLTAGIIFFIGLCIGSFLNVCIYRLPKDKSIVKPGSSCPQCGKLIRWYDNIPLLSYVFLGGKCRDCKAHISLRYPLVELLTAFLFLLAYHRCGYSLDLYIFCFFFAMLVLVSFVDIDYHAIPVYFCFIGIVGGMIFISIRSFYHIDLLTSDILSLPVIHSLIGMIFGMGFAYMFKFFGDVLLAFYLHFKKQDSIEGEKESLGLGDVDFLGMVGVFLGIKGAILTFFLAPFVAVLYAVYAFIFKKSHLIPYLPYLSVGCLIAFLWGDKILKLIF